MTDIEDKLYDLEQRFNAFIDGSFDSWHNLGAMSFGWPTARA